MAEKKIQRDSPRPNADTWPVNDGYRQLDDRSAPGGSAVLVR